MTCESCGICDEGDLSNVRENDASKNVIPKPFIDIEKIVSEVTKNVLKNY